MTEKQSTGHSRNMVVLSDYRNIYNKLDGLLVLMILMENSLLSHYHLQKKCRKYILLCSELILDRTDKDNMVLKQ